MSAQRSETDSPSPRRDSSAGASYNRSTKRKRHDTLSDAPKVKRPHGLYNDDYRILYNETLQLATSKVVFEGAPALSSSQIGLTYWTSEEKEDFFNALARFGKANLQGISSHVRTKSEVEIHVYIQLLENGLLEKLHKDKPLAPNFTDIPAAVELSQECVDALDFAGESLALYQHRYEEKVERDKWQDSWLLTQEVLRKLEKSHPHESDNIVFQSLDFLNVRAFLKLSKRIFMNSGSLPEANWQSVTEHPQVPSIRATTLWDLHSLIVSFTRRLIQTTLFFATSRLRVMDTKTSSPTPKVRRRDVLVACDVLKIRADAKDYWSTIAARSNLSISEEVKTSSVSSEAPVDSDNMEARVEQSDRINRSTRTYRSSVYLRDISEELSMASASGDSDQDDQRRGKSRSLAQSSAPEDSFPDVAAADQWSSDFEEDDYLEEIDERAAQVEEARLWKILGHKPPGGDMVDGIRGSAIAFVEGKEMVDPLHLRSVDLATERERSLTSTDLSSQANSSDGQSN